MTGSARASWPLGRNREALPYKWEYIHLFSRVKLAEGAAGRHQQMEGIAVPARRRRVIAAGYRAGT
jgi:hypothetical protein